MREALAGEADLVAAILADPDASPTIVLRGAGLDIAAIENAVAASAEAVPVAGESKVAARELAPGSILARFGRDLTALARKGSLPIALGRDAEVRELLRALCRQTKNAPLLIGEAGVGKTAIVEELANRIVKGDVPEALAGKRVVEITMSSLVAGTKYRGEFEDRMEKLVREARENPDILLFVDEIHSLVGAGAAEGSPMAAGDVLKPSLARGEIRVIGATTPRDYAQTIEKDGALARRFQTIRVEEPSPDASLEAHLGVKILPDSVEAAVTLSVRYLPDRKLPDKEIDLLDEACVRLRVRSFAGKFTNEVTADLVVSPRAPLPRWHRLRPRGPRQPQRHLPHHRRAAALPRAHRARRDLPRRRGSGSSWSGNAGSKTGQRSEVKGQSRHGCSPGFLNLGAEKLVHTTVRQLTHACVDL